MGVPYLAELRIMAFAFAPSGWAECNGQLMPINQNQALFALLGTMYGGNGQTDFALPDLRDRAPMHMGQGHTQGERAGSAAVTVTNSQMPTHLHFEQGSSVNADTVVSTNNILAVSQANIYLNPTQQNPNLTTIHPQTISNVGGSQPHPNEQPFLTLTYCIALQGAFPSQS